MNKNYTFSLCWNLTSEVEKAVKLLYDLNIKGTFHHIIVDLGFPIEADKIPEDFEVAKLNNTKKLKELASKYGSEYLYFENEGVSLNWTNVFDHIQPDDTDVLICVDPDEHPKNCGWVSAIGDVLREERNYGWISLVMPEHIPILNEQNTIRKIIAKRNVWEVIGNLNWAQGGFSCRFLNKVGGIPYLNSHPIYGHLETASLELMNQYGYTWAMLPDYIVEHTDYEKGSEGSSKLLREWKNFIIFNIERYGQITFEEYLIKRKTGEIINI